MMRKLLTASAILATLGFAMPIANARGLFGKHHRNNNCCSTTCGYPTNTTSYQSGCCGSYSSSYGQGYTGYTRGANVSTSGCCGSTTTGQHGWHGQSTNMHSGSGYHGTQSYNAGSYNSGYYGNGSTSNYYRNYGNSGWGDGPGYQAQRFTGRAFGITSGW